MQMRRGWIGLAVVGVAFLAGCEDEVATGGGPGEGGSGGAFVEDTLASVTPLDCAPLAPAQARTDTVDIKADSSRVIYLPGDGRGHSLWVWGDSAATRTVVIREMSGSTNGVEIGEPSAASTSAPWAMLILDARGCPADPPPFIVKRHDDGVFTVPEGGYDPTTSAAFALVRGNSGYMLSTPTRGPTPTPP